MSGRSALEVRTLDYMHAVRDGEEGHKAVTYLIPCVEVSTP